MVRPFTALSVPIFARYSVGLLGRRFLVELLRKFGSQATIHRRSATSRGDPVKTILFQAIQLSQAILWQVACSPCCRSGRTIFVRSAPFSRFTVVWRAGFVIISLLLESTFELRRALPLCFN